MFIYIYIYILHKNLQAPREVAAAPHPGPPGPAVTNE